MTYVLLLLLLLHRLLHLVYFMLLHSTPTIFIRATKTVSLSTQTSQIPLYKWSWKSRKKFLRLLCVNLSIQQQFFSSHPPTQGFNSGVKLNNQLAWGVVSAFYYSLNDVMASSPVLIDLQPRWVIATNNGVLGGGEEFLSGWPAAARNNWARCSGEEEETLVSEGEESWTVQGWMDGWPGKIA